jgi:hypothetical protein
MRQGKKRTPSGENSVTRYNWQLSSVILASGFTVFTGVFWELVITNGDRRYLIPAVIVHIMWAISWMLLTLPLFATWQDFSRKKMRIILASAISEGEPHKLPSPSIEGVEKLTPIALWNGFGSAATAVISFVFPIIHALLK